MKVACLIRSGAPMNHMVNEINSLGVLRLIVIEKPDSAGGLLGKILKHGLRRSFAIFRNKLLNKKRDEQVLDVLFPGNWQALPHSIPILEVSDVNAEEVRVALDDLRPDVIVDHGTSIVKSHILETSPLTLNLHWGLSPYYRGTHCTEWALLNWDARNIGVTVHKLSAVIDGGDIIGQTRVLPESRDTVHSINMKLTQEGTVIIVNILKDVLRGKELQFHKQDSALGYLAFLSRWDIHLENYVETLIGKGKLEEMLRRPSKAEEMPIVEYPISK